jgi:hypothetical protein
MSNRVYLTHCQVPAGYFDDHGMLESIMVVVDFVQTGVRVSFRGTEKRFLPNLGPLTVRYR